jgi:hypothetical protein
VVASVTPASSSASSGAASVNSMSVDQLVDALSQRMISVARSSPSVASDITEIETLGSTNAGDSFGGRAESARRRAGA